MQSRRHFPPGRRPAMPLLDAREGGPARRFARRLRGLHPAAVFFAAALAGLAVFALAGIALGLLLADVLLPWGGLARADERAVSSLAGERTPCGGRAPGTQPAQAEGRGDARPTSRMTRKGSPWLST